MAEANAYMTGRFGGGGWFVLTLAVREQLLITAFRWLVSEGVPKTATSDGAKWGQIELAWFINNNLAEYEDREALIASGVESFKLSKWEERLSKNGLPKKIKDLIAGDINLGGYFPDYTREY